MSKILTYPDKSLLSSTTSVAPGQNISVEIKEALLALSLEPSGAALAANQVGIGLSFFVVAERFVGALHKVIINPTVLFVNAGCGSKEEREGCLSFPGLYIGVRRPFSALIDYVNLENERVIQTLTGWDLRIFMHETDHLNGKTFIDNVPEYKRDKLLRNIRKRELHGEI